MTDTGKIDRSFFAEHIASRLGAPREDIRQGPQHGIDFGVIDVGEHALAVATDPISVLPELGFERAGRFAVRIVLADIAVSGLSPSHLSVSFALPPEMSDAEFATLWEAIDEECRALGVGIITGHTARYEGCQFPWVGHGTAFAVGDPAEIVFPDGARPGDTILVTNGPAVEVTGLFANLFPDRIGVDEGTLSRAQRRIDEIGAVRDARVATDAGRVTAMHDATEGGLLGACHEMAETAGVRFEIDTEGIPLQPDVVAVCEALDMDPWRATSAGTLLLTVEPDAADEIVAALERRGTPVGRAGQVTSGTGVLWNGEATSPPDGDASWPVYERLLEE